MKAILIVPSGQEYETDVPRKPNSMELLIGSEGQRFIVVSALPCEDGSLEIRVLEL
jgi:hypothetical protein